MIVLHHASSFWQVSFFLILVVAFQVAIAQFSLDRETKRRWQHALTGQALVLISYVLAWEGCVAALTVGFGGIWGVRFYQHGLYIKLFGPLLRPQELPKDGALPGAFWFLCGTLCCILWFPMPIARYAVACVSWADPMAAWVGKSLPSPRIHSSATVAGCVASLGTAVILGVVWFDLSWPAAIVGGMACSAAEAVPAWNDNFSIPLATALAVVGATSWLSS